MQYDVFIAYASPDRKVAQNLSSALRAAGHTVFLDSEVLVPGDEWTQKINAAQRQSFLTVILISDRSEAAYFQREEILQAISLARITKEHRVVPVYLSNRGIPDDVPYGLRQLHGLVLSKGILLEVAIRIEAALTLCKRQEEQLDGDEHPTRRTQAPEEAVVDAELLNAFSHTVKAVRDAGIKAHTISRLEHDYHTPSKPLLCSMVYVDIDDFTVINTRFGVELGDEIRAEFMKFFEQLLVYRWGGDEFLIYLPEIEENEALRFAENFRLDIESHSWSTLAPGLRVTASLGVAEQKEGEKINDWLIRTICGANESKKAGKNRVTRGPLALPRDMSRDVFRYGS